MYEKIKHLILDAQIPLLDDASVLVTRSPIHEPIAGNKSVVISPENANSAQGTAQLISQTLRITIWESDSQDDTEALHITADLRDLVQQILNVCTNALITGMSSPLVLLRKNEVQTKSSMGVSLLYRYTEVLNP